MAQITPRGKQKDVLALPPTGHRVVLGTAGSGKTTMAVLRAHYLATRYPDKRILLVTYNRALIAYLTRAFAALPPNVEVRNFHLIARKYLDTVGEMPNNCILDSKKRRREYIEQSIQAAVSDFGENSTLKRDVQIFIDEIIFLEKFGIESLEQYEQIERIGRAKAYIKRENRKYFYYVYEHYKAIRAQNGYLYDWDDLAYYMYKALLTDTDPRYFSHIVVDEGQDFSPVMIRALIHALPEDGSFIFFGDVAQQIYGGRLSWRDAGIKINSNEIWRFEENYRNSLEIVNFANDIIKSDYWGSSDDLIQPNSPKASGPKPLLVKCADSDDEDHFLLSNLKNISSVSRSALVVRNNNLRDYYIKLFSKAGLKVQKIHGKMSRFTISNGISIGTFHSVKGLEFDNIFIPTLNEGVFPDEEKMKTEFKEDAYSDEIKLLYVAVTRAKRNLIITYFDELSPLFPVKSNNYERISSEGI